MAQFPNQFLAWKEVDVTSQDALDASEYLMKSTFDLNLFHLNGHQGCEKDNLVLDKILKASQSRKPFGVSLEILNQKMWLLQWI